jgi:hypothetical protein
MKTFSQFLNDAYLCEEPSGRPARRRTGGPTPEEVKAEIDAKEKAREEAKAKRGPTGAAARQDLQFKNTKVTSPKGGPLALRPTSTPTSKPGALATRPTSTPTAPKGSPSNPDVIRTNTNVPGGASKLARGLRVAGRVAGPAAAALDVAAERSKGSGLLRSLAKGAVTAAGGAAGAAGGSVAGPVGTVAGGVGGAAAASKAFDTVAGKNAAERAADRLKNRQRQAGSEVKGIGGNTSFSQKKPGGPAFMSTGSGSQRKTVQLAKTGVVQRGGQSVAGNLAFKGGEAVYKAPDKPGTGTSNPLERIGRAVNPNAYKANDAKLAAQKLKTAQQNDAARNQKLGVKMKPGG